ncbi:diguanylate cyclase [Roseivivax halodurans JCM 10272]|uniref:diguanylate cyclase n=1 Tax=Roseivivax halodurans JCM 10272 TaxID=1449350 RepID=X7EHU8_9RHOB|nr:diguanylate cyclase [Roseivivax halodurans]ETX14766.1 diguanylate cyclase [Roseivivax halodurans JCM 10272]
MSGRILICDGTATHRIVLRVKLGTACYEVVQADSGASALDAALRERPDLVIVADTLPDMTARELCRRLRPLGAGGELPVLVIEDMPSPEMRLEALRAGAEDTLCRPISDMMLFARLRNLLRAREAERELRMRDESGVALGLAEDAAGFTARRRVALVHSGEPFAAPLADAIAAQGGVEIVPATRQEILRGDAGRPDAVFLLDPCGGQALDLVSELRARPETRRAGILFVTAADDAHAASRALDLGADDVVIGDALPEEIALRLDRIIRRRAVEARLRSTMEEGLRAAMTDPLTGLRNRRYALPHLERVDMRARESGRPYGVLLADIDQFKAINDTWGHAAGDLVLVAIARRLRENLRGADLVSRLGGEEFLVTLPDTDAPQTLAIAERLCARMREAPIEIAPCHPPIAVTVSIGAATGPETGSPDAESLIRMADSALYTAKTAGRDRVTAIGALPTPVAAEAPQRFEMSSISRRSRSA